MIPPEVVARLIVFVGPANLLGMWWNSRSVERERLRLETINAATNYIQRPTPERVTIIEGRLARLGLKGSVSDKDMVNPSLTQEWGILVNWGVGSGLSY